MELRHLRALVAIGDEGTITAAAAVVGISQPALSRTLDQLERTLNTKLVDRTTSSLRLTEAGRGLYQHAHQILNHLDDAISEATTSQARPLRVGYAWAALGRHTVPLMRRWRHEHPDIPVRMRRVDDPEKALCRGEIDMAFLRTHPGDDTFYSLPLLDEPRLAAVPVEDPLSEKSELALADLVERRIALCPTTGTTSTQLWPAGRRPSTSLNVANVDEWLATIATGETVGVTAEATSYSHPHPGVHYIPIVDADPVTVYLSWPPHPSHSAVPTFREHVQHAVSH